MVMAAANNSAILFATMMEAYLKREESAVPQQAQGRLAGHGPVSPRDCTSTDSAVADTTIQADLPRAQASSRRLPSPGSVRKNQRSYRQSGKLKLAWRGTSSNATPARGSGAGGFNGGAKKTTPPPSGH